MEVKYIPLIHWNVLPDSDAGWDLVKCLDRYKDFHPRSATFISPSLSPVPRTECTPRDRIFFRGE